MKAPAREPSARRFIFLVLFLLLGLIAAFAGLFMQDWVRENIIIPLYYMFWVLGRFVRSTPEVLFWTALVAFAFVSVLRSLSSRSQLPPLTGGGRQGAPRRDRLSFWLVQVHRCVLGEYSRQQFRRNLGSLIFATLAHQEHVHVKDVEDRLYAGTLEAPEKVLTFLHSMRVDRSTTQRSFWIWLRENIQSLFRNLTAPSSQRRAAFLETYLNQEVEEILSYLEQQVEIRHGNEH